MQEIDTQRSKWHQFPARDPRRVFMVLLAILDMGARATSHFIASELGCCRSDVHRAIDVLKRDFLVQIGKDGSRYVIEEDDFGVVNVDAVKRAVSDVGVYAGDAVAAA